MEDAGVEMISFDLNRKLKEKGSIAVKKEPELFIEPMISFAVGTINPLTLETRQSSMERYNSADSLDRMNQVTFYTALVCQKRSRHAQPLVDFLARVLASGTSSRFCHEIAGAEGRCASCIPAFALPRSRPRRRSSGCCRT
jgi:hypothetical protein